jgi:hypothetical protein
MPRASKLDNHTIEKKILEEMAQSWEKLANLRKRDREPKGEASF